MIEPLWDIAIVGAGPAGASAALSALHVRPDARILLLDRDDFPRDKACGDGIAPHVLDVLRSVGIVGIEAGYAGVDRLQIGFTSGPNVQRVMARAAYVIPRVVFDDRLVRAAVRRGSELRRHRVRTVAQEGAELVLDGEIRARVVIAADGASSVLRRRADPRQVRATAAPGSAQTAVAIRGYAPVSAGRSEQQVIVFSGPDRQRRPQWPAYAWSFPIGNGRANVGYGELLAVGRPLSRRHLIDQLAELLPGVGTGARDWRAHHLPLSTGRPCQPDGRILFVGDAMSLINPVTGEGIFYAVRSGVLAGRAALRVAECDPGRSYRSDLRRALGLHLRHTDAATLLARSPAVVAAAVRAADETPRIFDDLVELGLGDGRLTLSALRGIGAALLRR